MVTAVLAMHASGLVTSIAGRSGPSKIHRNFKESGKQSQFTISIGLDIIHCLHYSTF
jgi:hypothetical protein